jgi:hypothetical protein
MIELIEMPTDWAHIQQLAEQSFGVLVKAVVDVETETIALGGELHADEEAFLLERGSLQCNLWGINLYPLEDPSERVEFDSVINIRPSQGNRSRSVEDISTQERILKIVSQNITP